ncbi:MAG: urate hydroxylase PuuD [Pseudomonadota bacterium]
MDKFFANLWAVLVAGFALSFVIMMLPDYALAPGVTSAGIATGVFQWLHVWFGILWIGLLYYFNFVQVPTMPEIPAELKPGVSKYIAPKALFYFRWSALLTVLAGVVLAYLYGELVEVLTLKPGFRLIGIGAYLGLIMAFNVWFIIWPNQKKVLGLAPADDAAKARAGKAALIASRTNTLLSIPMLLCMTNFR